MELEIGHGSEHEEAQGGHAAQSTHDTGHGAPADTHGVAPAHGEAEGAGIPELENAVDYILLGTFNEDTPPDAPGYTSLHTIHNTVVVGDKTPFDLHGGEYPPQMSLTWLDTMNIIYSFLTILLLTAVALRVKSKLQKVPKGFQAFVELFVQWMDDYTCAIIGRKKGRAFTPFIGTLFIFILSMNYLGLVPFMKSPIALNLNMPLAMAICVFFLVQYHGIKENGIVGYLKHFASEPPFLIPLNFVLHLIGEIAKPLTLSLRLFGNITGEDVVIAALVGLTAGLAVFIPIPLQALFYPLGMLFGFIQALVFATLSAVYILLMSAHESHGEHH